MNPSPDTGNTHECHCDCHKYPDAIKHCIPCCFQCPTCGKNIETGYYHQHVKECKAEQNVEKKE